MALVAPNALQALKLFGIGRGKNKKDVRYKLLPALKRLEKRGLVEIRNEAGNQEVVLTQKGHQGLARHKMRERAGGKIKWDGKWRVVIFDIHEHKRKLRDQLRYELREFGFMKLQGSVWISPYECEEAIQLLKTDMRIGREMLYIVVDRIEGEPYLRRLFRL